MFPHSTQSLIYKRSTISSPSSPFVRRRHHRLLPRRSNGLPGVDLGLGSAVGLEGAASGGVVGAVLGDGPGAGVGDGLEGVVLRRGVDGVGEPGVPEGFDLGAVMRGGRTRALASGRVTKNERSE